MNVLGIVCEYNPFHMGHLYHMNTAKEKLGGDCATICVMSGDFVQRGEAATYSKFARAEAACRCGADLVIELPLPWALSSAESFARGAVGLLSKLGVTHICFGSEEENMSGLAEIAELHSNSGYMDDIKLLMSENASLSFAVARQKVIERYLGASAHALELPNNILAIEYLKAIRELKLDITPINIKRIGNGHDLKGEEGFKSASEIRELIAEGKNIEAYIPAAALNQYKQEDAVGRRASDKRALEAAIISRLRFFDEDYYNSLPDASDGLGSRIYRAAHAEPTLNEIYAAAKTKRYAMSRIRRICLCAALGIIQGMNEGVPPYARVLAANKTGCTLLKKIKNNSDFPIVTRASAVKRLHEDCISIFTNGAHAHDLFVLSYCDDTEKKGGMDWRNGPRIV